MHARYGHAQRAAPVTARVATGRWQCPTGPDLDTCVVSPAHDQAAELGDLDALEDDEASPGSAVIDGTASCTCLPEGVLDGHPVMVTEPDDSVLSG